MAQIYLMFTGPHLHSRRCKHLAVFMTMSMATMRNILIYPLIFTLPLLLYFFLFYFFLRSLFVTAGLNLKKDISNHTGLILLIVQLLDGSIIRRSDFRKLLIGFHIS